MRWIALVGCLGVLAACSSKGPTAPANVASGSGTGSAEPRPYAGPPDRGPCQDAHGCQLRDVCGCSCEAVSLSTPKQIACDESCPDKDICKGYSLICDQATQTCGAIPPAK